MTMTSQVKFYIVLSITWYYGSLQSELQLLLHISVSVKGSNWLIYGLLWCVTLFVKYHCQMPIYLFPFYAYTVHAWATLFRPHHLGIQHHHAVDTKAAPSHGGDHVPMHVKRMSSLLEHASHDKKQAMVRKARRQYS